MPHMHPLQQAKTFDFVVNDRITSTSMWKRMESLVEGTSALSMTKTEKPFLG